MRKSKNHKGHEVPRRSLRIPSCIFVSFVVEEFGSLMNKRRSIGIIALAAILFLPTLAAAKKLNVITATTDMAALTQEVGGDHVTVEAIARGYQDPHFVEAKPSFLLKLRQADLLVVVGLQ